MSDLRTFARSDFADLPLDQPWSPDEVTLLMQRVVVKLESEVATLKTLGTLAAEARRDAETLEAQWMLIAKRDRPELKSDTMRRSWALQDPETGLASAVFQADRAERLYKDHAVVVRSVQHQGEQLRSLLSRHKDLERTWHPGRDLRE